MNISKEIFDFWTGFNDYTDQNKADKLCQWAGKKAYLDMNRTLEFKEKPTKGTEKEVSKKRKDMCNQAIEIMKKYFGEMKDDYNGWHQELCDSIIRKYDGFLKKKKSYTREMTYGHAQKWVNMTIKYMWLVYAVSPEGLSYYDSLMQRTAEFHIPLDSYILKYVKSNIGNPQNAAELKRIDNEKMKQLDEWSGWTWSKMDDYDKYSKYQEYLREAIAGDPLEWELVHWIKALN